MMRTKNKVCIGLLVLSSILYQKSKMTEQEKAMKAAEDQKMAAKTPIVEVQEKRSDLYSLLDMLSQKAEPVQEPDYLFSMNNSSSYGPYLQEYAQEYLPQSWESNNSGPKWRRELDMPQVDLFSAAGDFGSWRLPKHSISWNPQYQFKNWQDQY